MALPVKQLPKSAALVVNARSRKGRDLFDQACARLKARGIELVAAHAVRDPDQLRPTIRAVLDDGAPMVIVGGGVSHAWDLLAPAIEETLSSAAPITGTPLKIQRAKRGGDAVALGAAASAQQLFRARQALAPTSPHTTEGAVA